MLNGDHSAWSARPVARAYLPAFVMALTTLTIEVYGLASSSVHDWIMLAMLIGIPISWAIWPRQIRVSDHGIQRGSMLLGWGDIKEMRCAVADSSTVRLHLERGGKWLRIGDDTFGHGTASSIAALAVEHGVTVTTVPSRRFPWMWAVSAIVAFAAAIVLLFVPVLAVQSSRERLGVVVPVAVGVLVMALFLMKRYKPDPAVAREDSESR